jgi:hypothetical protein
VVVDLLGAAQRRGPRFRPGPFLDSLRAAYELVIARQGKKADAVMRLIDVCAVLTLLPGQGREYTKQEFARDLYLLDQSGVTVAPPRRAAAALEREHRDQGRRRADHGGARGQQQRYWGISFSLPVVEPDEPPAA